MNSITENNGSHSIQRNQPYLGCWHLSSFPGFLSPCTLLPKQVPPFPYINLPWTLCLPLLSGPDPHCLVHTSTQPSFSPCNHLLTSPSLLSTLGFLHQEMVPNSRHLCGPNWVSLEWRMVSGWYSVCHTNRHGWEELGTQRSFCSFKRKSSPMNSLLFPWIFTSWTLLSLTILTRVPYPPFLHL